MAHVGPRGVRLQLYQWHQKWSLACKVSDTDTTLSYGMTSFCHYSLHCDTTFFLHLIWCIGPLKKPLMLDSFVSFLAKMVNTVCTCWMQGYAMSSWLICEPTHGWSHLVKRRWPRKASSKISWKMLHSECCAMPKVIIESSIGDIVSVLKLASVLAERWRRDLVTFQLLQPYKASSFSLKGINALSVAAWPSKLVKAGTQLCPKAVSAHQLYQR